MSRKKCLDFQISQCSRLFWLLSKMRCKYVGEGRGWGSLGGREESTALGLGFIDHSSPHLLRGLLAFLRTLSAEIWAGVTRTLVSSGLIRVWRSPWIAGYHLLFSGITGPLNPCPPSGTEAGCPWMDSPHPAFARAPSLSSPGWHTGSKLSYFLISPLGSCEPPDPSPTTVVPTDNQEVLRKATLQAVSLPNCLHMDFGMGQPERSCLSIALDRNRVRTLIPLAFPDICNTP